MDRNKRTDSRELKSGFASHSVARSTLLDMAVDDARGSVPLTFPNHTSPELSIIVTQPVVEAPDNANTTQIPSRGLTIGAVALDTPLIDEYFYRALGFKLRDQIIAFNQEKSQNFFSVYPECLITTAGNNLYDVDSQVNALITYIRDYVNAVTQYLGAIANIFAWSGMQGTPTAKRMAYVTRWSVFWTAHNDLQGMPIPQFVYDYIVRNTRILTGKDYLGGDLVIMPLWNADLRGGRFFQSLTASGDTQKFIGHVPLNVDVDNALTISTGNEDTTGFASINHSSDGGSYIGDVMIELARGWHDYLTDATTLVPHAKMLQKSYAIRKVFELLGLLTKELDMGAMRLDILKNDPGDVEEFAKKNMTFASTLTGSWSQKTVDFRLYKSGVTPATALTSIPWVSPDASFAAAWNGAGTAWCDLYSRILSAGTARNMVDIQNKYLLKKDPQEQGLVGWGFWLDMLNGASAAVYSSADDFRDFKGVTPEFVEGFINPEGQGKPAVFTVQAELNIGHKVIHQAFRPLVNTEDPIACGYLIVVAYEDNDNNLWTRFFTDNTTRTNWATSASKLKDAFMYVGDAIALHPMIHFSRDWLAEGWYSTKGWTFNTGLGVAPTANTDFRAMCSVPMKPYTIPIPLSLTSGGSRRMYHSGSVVVADLPWIVIDYAQNLWSALVATFNAITNVPLLTSSADVPQEWMSYAAWTWFRLRKTLRSSTYFGFTKQGWFNWVTAFPTVRASNVLASMARKYIDLFKDGTVELTDTGKPGASVLKFQGPSSPMKPQTNRFQAPDRKPESRGGYRGGKRHSYHPKPAAESKPRVQEPITEQSPIGAAPKDEFRDGDSKLPPIK